MGKLSISVHIFIAVIFGVVVSLVVSWVFMAAGITPEKGFAESLLIVGSGVASGAGLFLLIQSKLFKV